MRTLGQHFRSIGILILLPVVGIACTLIMNTSLEIFRINEACRNPKVLVDHSQACSNASSITLLHDVSWITLFASLALPVVFFLVAFVIGQSRLLIAVVFSVLVKLSILATIILVFVNAGILTFSLYWSFALGLGKVPIGVLAIIGFGGLAAAFGLLRHVFSLGRKLELRVVGQRVEAKDHPTLVNAVSTIAQRVGANPPDHIIAGMDANFYVTSARVALLGDANKLSGETLYLSAPLLRVLTAKEFIAVVAHELGHFAGKDTIYSNRFAPIYAQLAHSLNQMRAVDQLADIAKLPGLALLGILMAIFSSKERKVGRKRELEADKKAAAVAGPEPLISALVKISLFARHWIELRKANIDALNRGQIVDNLCSLYVDYIDYKFQNDRNALDTLAFSLEGDKVTHPTDTHPTNHERAANIGVDIDVATRRAISELEQHLDSLNNRILSESFEKELTIGEHRLLLQIGLAELPENNEGAS